MKKLEEIILEIEETMKYSDLMILNVETTKEDYTGICIDVRVKAEDIESICEKYKLKAFSIRHGDDLLDICSLRKKEVVVNYFGMIFFRENLEFKGEDKKVETGEEIDLIDFGFREVEEE